MAPPSQFDRMWRERTAKILDQVRAVVRQELQGIAQGGKVRLDKGSGSIPSGSLPAHNILSDKHGDADSTDTPADLDVLTYRSSDGKWHAAPGASADGQALLLFSQVVDKTVANTTTETSLLSAGRGSKTLPADALGQGTTVRLELAGHVRDTGNPSLDIKVTLGGTELCSTGAQNLNTTVTEADWHLEVLITCRAAGASGTVVASGIFDHDDGTSFGLVNSSEVTVDTTAALALDVTATWGTADAANAITCQEATIEELASDGLALAGPSNLQATETV